MDLPARGLALSNLFRLHFLVPRTMRASALARRAATDPLVAAAAAVSTGTSMNVVLVSHSGRAQVQTCTHEQAVSSGPTCFATILLLCCSA